MNKFKHMKKILKQCIHQLDESISLFVINPEKDFTRKRKHLFGDTLMNLLLLEGGSLKDELYKLFVLFISFVSTLKRQKFHLTSVMWLPKKFFLFAEIDKIKENWSRKPQSPSITVLINTYDHISTM